MPHPALSVSPASCTLFRMSFIESANRAGDRAIDRRGRGLVRLGARVRRDASGGNRAALQRPDEALVPLAPLARALRPPPELLRRARRSPSMSRSTGSPAFVFSRYLVSQMFSEASCSAISASLFALSSNAMFMSLVPLMLSDQAAPFGSLPNAFRRRTSPRIPRAKESPWPIRAAAEQSMSLK